MVSMDESGSVEEEEAAKEAEEFAEVELVNERWATSRASFSSVSR